MKHERADVAALDKAARRPRLRQRASDNQDGKIDDVHALNGAKMCFEHREGAVGGPGGAPVATQSGVVEGGDSLDKEKPLFLANEADSLIAHLVESQQAFSLINVADIQHGEYCDLVSLVYLWCPSPIEYDIPRLRD